MEALVALLSEWQLFIFEAQHYAELTLKPKISPFAQAGFLTTADCC